MFTLLLALYLFLFGLILIWETIAFLFSVYFKRNDVADVAWGIGLIFLAVNLILFLNSFNDRSILILSLVILWGVRLSIYLLFRISSKKEDFRYVKWRKKWKNMFYIKSYFKVFVLQGLAAVVLFSPVMYIMVFSFNNGLNYLDLLGFFIWLIGFTIEMIADMQLNVFLSEPKNKGKFLKEGLWKYSRHPNYYGEILMWWGIFVIALSVPYGYLAIISPLLITILLNKVSGVPMLENKLKNNKTFQKYKQTTNAIIVWPFNK